MVCLPERWQGRELTTLEGKPRATAAKSTKFQEVRGAILNLKSYGASSSQESAQWRKSRQTEMGTRPRRVPDAEFLAYTKVECWTTVLALLELFALTATRAHVGSSICAQCAGRTTVGANRQYRSTWRAAALYEGFATFGDCVATADLEENKKSSSLNGLSFRRRTSNLAPVPILLSIVWFAGPITLHRSIADGGLSGERGVGLSVPAILSSSSVSSSKFASSPCMVVWPIFSFGHLVLCFGSWACSQQRLSFVSLNLSRKINCINSKTLVSRPTVTRVTFDLPPKKKWKENVGKKKKTRVRKMKKKLKPTRRKHFFSKKKKKTNQNQKM